MYTKPTVEEFKAYFTRDFPYNDDPELGITDGDIAKAMGEASMMINDRLAGDQNEYNILFYLVTAHYLVMDMRAASQGIAGNYSWLTGSKAVASVSESYIVPDVVMNNPILAMFSKTFYGAKYLNLIYGNMIGVMFTVHGRTHP